MIEASESLSEYAYNDLTWGQLIILHLGSISANAGENGVLFVEELYLLHVVIVVLTASDFVGFKATLLHKNGSQLVVRSAKEG